jgi:hypothetical protein
MMACGSSGDGRPSTDELVGEGDEICTEARERIAELQKEPPESAGEAAEFTRRLIEITEQELAELRSLEVPEETRDAFNRYLRSRERALAIIREGLRAAERGDAQAYAAAQAKVTEAQVERAQLAERAGLSECSRPLAAGG